MLILLIIKKLYKDITKGDFMVKTKSGIVLQEGEELVVELEAELWATSSNVISQKIGQILKFIARILGMKRTGHLVITNKRVIEVANIYNCYVFNVAKNVKYILPSSIKEVGFNKKTVCGVFCAAYYFFYASHTQSTQILLSVPNEEEAQKIVDAFYNAISYAQTK